MGQFKCRVVSPKAVLVDDEYEMVVVPGSEGDLSAEEGSSPLLTSLRPGMIELYKGGKVSERYMTYDGFCEVSPVSCVITCDQLTPVSEIKTAEMASLQASASDTLSTSDVESEEYAKAENDYLYAEIAQYALTL